MRNRITVCTLLTTCTFGVLTAAAQRLSVGAKGGLWLRGRTIGQDESRRYVVGPSIELRLPAGFALEVDGLYRRVGDTTLYVLVPNSTPSSYSSFVHRQRGHSWEFPILGKYYFKARTSSWQPFLGTGYAFRTTWFHVDTMSTTVDSASNTVTTTSFASDYRGGLDVGAALAAGVRLNKGRFAVLPEFRYTRWGSGGYLMRKNEAKVLLGFQF